MALPLAELRIQRAPGWLCDLLLGRQFQTMVPGVMERPRQLAEQPSAVPAARTG